MEYRDRDIDRIPDDAPSADVPLAHQTNDPTVALGGQVEAMQAAPGAQQDDVLRRGRAERLSHWISEGMEEHEAQFFAANPLMIDYPDKAVAAVKQAHQQGYQPGSDDYFSAVKSNFAKRMENPAGAVDRVVDEARVSPERTREPSAPAEDVFEYDNARVVVSPKRVAVSAPPSRSDTIAASYMGGRDYDLDRGRITLSQLQKEAARISGCSEQEYALQLIRLRDEKLAGNYQGGG